MDGRARGFGRVTTLLDNGISALVPCSPNVRVVKDSRVKDYGCVDTYGLLSGFDKGSFFLQALTERVLKDLHTGAKILLTCRHGTTRSAILAALVLMAGADCSADDAHSYLRYLRNLVDLKSVPASWQKKDGVDPLDLLREHCATIQAFWKGEKMLLNCVITPGAFEYQAVEAGCIPIMPDEALVFASDIAASMSICQIVPFFSSLFFYLYPMALDEAAAVALAIAKPKSRSSRPASTSVLGLEIGIRFFLVLNVLKLKL